MRKLAREQSSPKNQESYISRIQGPVGRGEDCLLPHWRVDIKASISSSSLCPIWMVCPGLSQCLFKSVCIARSLVVYQLG